MQQGPAMKLVSHLQLVLKLDWSCTPLPHMHSWCAQGQLNLYQILIEMLGW
jgi:hypothetical protein